MWGGAPNRWAPPAPDRAEPTDGRHAFDRDAALTPIFTALRRGARRRLRAVPEPVEFDRGDPPTAPIPVVPALHAVDPYPTGGYAAPPVDPFATGGTPMTAPRAASGYPVVAPHETGGHRYPTPPSPNEMTAVWYPSDDATPWSPVTESGRYSPVTDTGRYSPVTESGRYSPVTDTGRHHRRLAPAGW